MFEGKDCRRSDCDFEIVGAAVAHSGEPGFEVLHPAHNMAIQDLVDFFNAVTRIFLTQ